MQLIIKSLLLLCSSAIVVVGTADAAATFVGGNNINWQHSNIQKQLNILISPSCSSDTKRVHMTTQSSLSMDDPRVEPRVMYKIDISLPLGLILEDMDSDHSYGVHIVGISPEGNAGESNIIIQIIVFEIKRVAPSSNCEIFIVSALLFS